MTKKKNTGGMGKHTFLALKYFDDVQQLGDISSWANISILNIGVTKIVST